MILKRGSNSSNERVGVCLPHGVVVVVEQRAGLNRPRARGVRRAPAGEDPSVLRLERG